MKITKRTDDDARRLGAMHAGPIPAGAEVLGLVTREGEGAGALVRLHNGVLVQITGGAMRTLPPPD